MSTTTRTMWNIALFIGVLVGFSTCQLLEFKGMRNIEGDDILKLPANITCDGLVGVDTMQTRSECRCRSDKPIFHFFNLNEYGCSSLTKICKECEGFATGHLESPEKLKLNLPKLKADNEIGSCNSSRRRAVFYIFQKSDYINLFEKELEDFQEEEKETVIELNITNVPFELVGKLAKLQLWCAGDNQTDSMVTDMKKENSYMVKIMGNFSYPDNETYYALTTPTASTTSGHFNSTAAPVKKSGSKNLIFFVVIPVAAFLILVAIIIICISKKLQKRDKETRENSYKLKDSQLSNGKEGGVSNPAYTSDTIMRNDGVDGKSKNNNESLKDTQKPNEDIKIYTVVDLSQQPVSQQQIPDQVTQIDEKPQFASQTTLPRKRSNDVIAPDDDVIATAVNAEEEYNRTVNKKYSQFSNTSSASEISDHSDNDATTVDIAEVELADSIDEETEEEAKRREFEGTLKRSKEMLDLFMNDFLSEEDAEENEENGNDNLSKFPMERENSKVDEIPKTEL